MNNYSWLQKKLHRIALSYRFIREASFDLESTLATSLYDDGDHVFVSGLARSGTTIILNAIYKSNLFASLSYSDMPFVLAPNLWAKMSFAKISFEMIERAHGDGIKISTSSPEAFEEVFWKTFSDERDVIENFKRYVELILIKYDKNRYLSKNNQNVKRLVSISKTFPNAKILIPFRSPAQQAHSLLRQHKNFIDNSKNDAFISDYMKWIGHTEFGPNYEPVNNQNLKFGDSLDINHWLEQWYHTYKNCIMTMSKKPNVYFICYEKLCSRSTYWKDILKNLNIDKTYDYQFHESKKHLPETINIDHFKKVSLLYEELRSLSCK